MPEAIERGEWWSVVARVVGWQVPGADTTLRSPRLTYSAEPRRASHPEHTTVVTASRSFVFNDVNIDRIMSSSNAPNNPTWFWDGGVWRTGRLERGGVLRLRLQLRLRLRLRLRDDDAPPPAGAAISL